MNITFNVTISKDRSAAQLVLLGDNSRIAAATLDAADCDGLLSMLSKVRADLADAVSDDLEPNARVSPVYDPKWQLGDSPQKEILLAVRHPGFGWITLKFPKNEAAALGAALLELTSDN